jgi:hypothetical protein
MHHYRVTTDEDNTPANSATYGVPPPLQIGQANTNLNEQPKTKCSLAKAQILNWDKDKWFIYHNPHMKTLNKHFHNLSQPQEKKYY